MKKLIFLSILIFSVFSNAEVKEQALGKMEGYPNNCDYLKGNYTKCQIAWSSANDAPNSPMVRRFIKKGDATRELIVEPNKLGSFQKTTLDNLVKNYNSTKSYATNYKPIEVNDKIEDRLFIEKIKFYY